MGFTVYSFSSDCQADMKTEKNNILRLILNIFKRSPSNGQVNPYKTQWIRRQIRQFAIEKQLTVTSFFPHFFSRMYDFDHGILFHIY